MRAPLFVVVLIIIGIICQPHAFAAQKNYEFGIRQIPEKISENNEVIFEIYSLKNKKIFPIEIDNLSATSQNPDILQIKEIKRTDSFTTQVVAEALNQGSTKIAIAAPSFESKEFPITINNNNQIEKKILIKALPNMFTPNGPRNGYIAVELVDKNGLPISTKEDVIVTLTTSNNKILDFGTNEVVIKKGNYYAIQDFKINSFTDSVTVYASAQNVETAKETIHIVKPKGPLKVQLYIFPDKASRNAITNTYAIVQLQDANGKPIKATEDIPISIKISDPSGTKIKLNDRGKIPTISPAEPLTIKKGDYLAVTELVTNVGLLGTYEVAISANNYQASPVKKIEVVETDLVEDRNIVFNSLPVLADGKEKLIGIVHLEDTDKNLLLADDDMEIKIYSSDEEILSVNNINIKKSQIAGKAYAKVGYLEPSSLTLHEQSENKQLSSPTIFGPKKQTLKLVTEPLVPNILANSNYPVVAYMRQSDGSAWFFPEDAELFFSPGELTRIEESTVQKGDTPQLLDAFATKAGKEKIIVKSNIYSADLSVENQAAVPSNLMLDVPPRIFSGMPNTFVAQILDSNNNPLYSNERIDIKIISNEPEIIDIEEPIMIQKGEHFTSFQVTPKTKGTAEIAVLATGFPLSKKTIEVYELVPEIKSEFPEIVDAYTPFVSTISATFDGIALSDLDVDWNVEKGVVQEKDVKTNSEGKATISILSDEKNIGIKANVSGKWFNTATLEKTVKVNATSIAAEEKIETEEDDKITLFGYNPFLVTLPLIIAASGIVLHKKGFFAINK